MLCNAFDQRVDQLLDERERLDADDQIRTHAAVCPRCRAVLGAHLQLLDVMRQVESHDPAKPARAGMPLVGVVAVAATLLLAVTLGFLAFNASANPPGIALKVEPTVEPVAKFNPVASRPESFLVRNDEPLSTTSDPYFVHQPLVGLRLLSMGDWSTAMSSIDMPFGAEIPVQTEWVDAVADGISPVQNSFTSTLNLIRRTLATGSPRQS